MIIWSDLYPVLQSAYRRSDSTETALLKVGNDILAASYFTCPFRYAAFHTVDHRILFPGTVHGKVLELS